MANIISALLGLVTIALVGQLSAIAQSCYSGHVQLSHNTMNNRSYVQYCIDSTWRTLCTRSWSRVEANVVCRQLGYSDQGAIKGVTDFGDIRMGKFFMFSQSCAGGENTLAECKPTNTLENCGTSEKNRQGWVKCIPANCTDGSLRLVGGSNIRQGRVEVCQNKRWGTMCYNQALAGHVCSQLGFPSQGAAAKEMNTTGPQINCNIDTNNRLSCRNITDSGLCARGLAVECPSFSDTIATSALGAVIGLLVLLEVGTVIAWVACTVTRKRNSSPTKQRALLQVNESYTHTAPIEPSYSSLGPNYNTVTTSDERIGDYDVLDHNKPKPSTPPPMKVEAIKSENEFYNAEEHMYAAVNKEKKNNV